MADNNYKVAVLGGGSFGTAIANMIADKGTPVTMWIRSEQRAKQVMQSRENSYYFARL